MGPFRVDHNGWPMVSSRPWSRASKSPDLAGDHPIFDNENLPIARFGMKISRFITRDSRLARSRPMF